MSDSVIVEDPTIIDSVAKHDRSKGYLTTEEEPTELASVTFEAGDGTERTISVGERLIADNGKVVGEIERIYRADYDTSKRIHAYESTHWVVIDYGVGDYWEDNAGTGGIALGETAAQMADGSMTTER